MKKIIIIVMSFFMITSLNAQSDMQRTAKTKVADALAKLPAQNQQEINQYIGDIASTGEEGALELAKMMNANVAGDNTVFEFAVNGLSYYVMNKGQESARRSVEQGYLKALPLIKDKELIVFFIRQLEIVGSAVAVKPLSEYLQDDYLAPFVCRAYAKGGSDEAKRVLEATLDVAMKNNKRDVAIAAIQAIGDLHDAEAEEQILALAKATTSDEILKKELHFCIGRVGSAKSLPYISAEAKKVNYDADYTYATDGYIRLVKRLTEVNQTPEAEKEALALLARCSSSDLPHIKTTALQILVGIRKESSSELILQALSDPTSSYRRAALVMYEPYTNDRFNKALETKLQAASPALQKDIILFFAATKAQSAVKSLLPLVESKDVNVKKEAVNALAVIGGQEAIVAISNLIASPDAQDVKLAYAALMYTKGDIGSAVLSKMRSATVDGKAACLELFGARAIGDYNNRFFAAIADRDQLLRNAAIRNLKYVVWEKDLSVIYTLLESSDKRDLDDYQDAVIAALGLRCAQKKIDIVSERMLNIPFDKQGCYYGILAKLGGVKTLALVVDGFKKGNTAQKEYAFDALLQWNGLDACYEIYAICKEDPKYLTEGFKGYLSSISRSTANGTQKLLFLRKLMELATTAEMKKEVLKEVLKTRTLNGIIFASNYLDDKDLSVDAAKVIRSISLTAKQFDGEMVKALVEKADNILAKTDGEYVREEAQLHLKSLSAENGFVSLFNGKDLSGWKGLVSNPIKRAAMSEKELAAAQVKADEEMRSGWYVKDGLLVFSGKGNNLCTDKMYGDFEMLVDWKITKGGDAGIYLRGAPQVQIWDTAQTNVGAQVGSGGLYNNAKNRSTPLALADNRIGEWNTFHIVMKGERVTVFLNGVLVVDNVVFENYWNRAIPIFDMEQLELQAHGSYVAYRDIYVKEYPKPKRFELSDQEKKEGYKVLFDGVSMNEWIGNIDAYVPENGVMEVYPAKGRGNLYSKEEYADFVLRFEFNLPPGANNGLGIRTPLSGDAAYVGSELQILDNEHPIYANLTPYQYHGSLYGVLPAKRGFLKPSGEWNYQEVMVKGTTIKIVLNGETILDGDWGPFIGKETPDKKAHPGLANKKGHIGFLGHGDRLKFRNIRIKTLD